MNNYNEERNEKKKNKERNKERNLGSTSNLQLL
jgi:hypothetical protein